MKRKYLGSTQLPIERFLNSVKELFLHYDSKLVRSKPFYDDKTLKQKVNAINEYSLDANLRVIVYVHDTIKSCDRKMTIEKLLTERNIDKVINKLKIYSFVLAKVILKSHCDLSCSCYNFVKTKACAHVFDTLKSSSKLCLIELPLPVKKTRGRPRRDTNSVDQNYFKH